MKTNKETPNNLDKVNDLIIKALEEQLVLKDEIIKSLKTQLEISKIK